MEVIIGSDIVGKEGSRTNVSAKYVGLYFSAHWCPPCRQFTPELSIFYENMKVTKAGELEIVFVSCDKDEESYQNYYQQMPWLSLPFDSPLRKDASLGQKFGISGIPSLVILDGQTGKLVQKDGRSMVSKDPTGSNFPWIRNGNVEQIIGTDFVGKDGTKVTLTTKYVGLYFSAHWCPPCRSFTPDLAKFYTEFTKNRPGELEIVFVSFDQDESSYNEYFQSMPWISLPFDSPLKEQLGEEFEVEGIPTLIIVDRVTSAVMQADGRSFVSSDPTGESFPWEGKTAEESDE